MRRTDDPWKFWVRFSYDRDGHPRMHGRLWNHFWRSFSVLYFLTIITQGRRGRAAPTRERLVRYFAFFQERLAPGAEFLGGTAPGTADLQLFGLVQMCASIPGPSLAVLRQEPTLQRLREWVESMQRRAVDYPRLYSALDFEPKCPVMQEAPALERLSYWVGSAFMWAALPVTLPTVLHFARKVQKLRAQAA